MIDTDLLEWVKERQDFYIKRQNESHAINGDHASYLDGLWRGTFTALEEVIKHLTDDESTSHAVIDLEGLRIFDGDGNIIAEVHTENCATCRYQWFERDGYPCMECRLRERPAESKWEGMSKR